MKRDNRGQASADILALSPAQASRCSVWREQDGRTAIKPGKQVENDVRIGLQQDRQVGARAAPTVAEA
jgi:hypothetical protein